MQEIFENLVRKNRFQIEEEALTQVKEMLTKVKQEENFGNARFIRNLYEKTLIKHATNTKNTTSEKALKTITIQDIDSSTIDMLNHSRKNKIGF